MKQTLKLMIALLALQLNIAAAVKALEPGDRWWWALAMAVSANVFIFTLLSAAEQGARDGMTKAINTLDEEKERAGR